jgi:hypothetical protein
MPGGEFAEKKLTSNIQRPTSSIELEKRKTRNGHSRFDIGFLKANEIKLRSVATSLFDV